MIFHYLIFSLALALGYCVLIALYLRDWRRLPRWSVPEAYVPRTSVTVLVPARNEAAGIAACLQSILSVDYPRHLLEVLVIDDHSEDDTAAIVRKLAVPAGVALRLLPLGSESSDDSKSSDDLRQRTATTAGLFGKKKAIELGVRAARGELIVATDADCLVPPDWLLLFVSLYESRRPGAIVAPVSIHLDRNGLQHFQALELAGLMGISGAGLFSGWHRMGNGANLCYPKTLFEAVGGFAGNADLASGDDFFLLQKIARRAEVLFLKNTAAVRTEAAAGFHAFFRQRLRWSTKNAALPERGVKLSLALIFFLCCSILLNAVLIFFQIIPAWLVAIQLAAKAWADYALLREMCGFFGRRDLLRWFWPSFCFHTLYVAATGVASLFVRRYIWKGRRLR